MLCKAWALLSLFGVVSGNFRVLPENELMFKQDQYVQMKKPINANPSCDREVHSDDRVDCHPDSDASPASCESRGCCWHDPTNGGPEGIPLCYFPLGYPSFHMTNISTYSWGHRLSLSGPSVSHWPRPVPSLYLDLIYETADRFHFKIFDATQKRYEVPIAVPKFTKYPSNTQYKIEIRENPIGITIKRRSTGAIIFDSADVFAPLIFTDQLLQLTAATGAKQLYGLGEHRGPLLKDFSKFYQFSFWARDGFPMTDTNLYGDHPFYMAFEGDSSDMHGVFFLNSNAMDLILQPAPSITFRPIGGIFDMYFFLGPTPEHVTQQYATVVGLPALPPYWALGFHLCRWGYETSAHLKEIIQRTRATGIPYDVQWNDIDYMKDHLDFTYDPDRFGDLPAIVEELHSSGQHYVMITDPGISSSQASGSYGPYDSGLQQKVFITKHGSDIPVEGKVWPGQTVFPDFTNPKTQDWWQQQIKEFHDKISFDGLWIDMNEPSNMLDGAVNGCSNSSLDNPPYTPGILGDGLAKRTICPSSQQWLGSHYDLHNLYGLTEMNATYRALQVVRQERPLVISRSTFSSAGRYGGHWSGDIGSSWEAIAYTIPEILKFNLFAVPLVGSDICGFNGETTEELCTRWMQLGAFYPFMRNHNALGFRAQDPGAFSKSAQQAMVNATSMRYTLLPYLYTLFFEAASEGKPVARPLFYNFADDAATRAIDTQFMWGSCLLISPALQLGQTQVSAYFPSGGWYDLWSGIPLRGGGTLQLATPLSHIPLHVRAGCVLPTLPSRQTTTLQRSESFILKAYLDDNGETFGSLFWDDGKSLDVISKENYVRASISCSKQTCSTDVAVSGGTMPFVDAMSIAGYHSSPQQVLVNGNSNAFTYNVNTTTISVSGFHVPLKGFVLSWS